MDTNKYKLLTAEKYAIAMMKQGRSTPQSIRTSAKSFNIDEYELAKQMKICLDVFSFNK